MQQQSSLDRLALFAAVVESRSFSAAAARFALPRSSVSRAIAALESDVGAQLLHRTTRRVEPSPAGRLLFERIAPGLSTLQSALATPLADDDEAAGALRITAVPDFAMAVLKDVLAAFVLRHPRIRVELLLNPALVDLRAEGVDVAFRFSFGRLRGGGLVARKLGPVSLALFASPSYLARAGTPRSVDEVAAGATVCFSAFASNARGRVRFTDGATTRVVQLSPTIACNDMATCAALVKAGAGVGVLPAHLARDDVVSGALVPLLPAWRAGRWSAWMVFRSKPLPARVAVFRDFVVAAAASWFSQDVSADR